MTSHQLESNKLSFLAQESVIAGVLQFLKQVEAFTKACSFHKHRL